MFFKLSLAEKTHQTCLFFYFSKQHAGENGCYKHYITFINYSKLNPYQTAALGPYLQTS